MIDWTTISLKELAGLQGLEQVINICLEQKIDVTEVERWSKKEKQEEKFRIFKERLEMKQ